MRDRKIVELVGGTPWAIRPEKLETIRDLVAMHVAGERLSQEEVEERLEAARRPRPQVAPRQGSIAVLPLQGVIVPKAGLMSDISGGCALDTWCADLYALMADPNVAAIVVDVDSPGGSVDMVPETARALVNARKAKPIVAVANTEAASAAYWLASCCSELYVTDSGQVGSIGVYSAHQDLSAALESEGVKVTLVKAGKYKAERSPFGPLSDEALQAMQAEVDHYYGMFCSAVAQGRATTAAAVADGFGEGRMVTAQDAVKLGMADGVATLADTVSRLVASAGSQAAKARRRADDTLELAALDGLAAVAGHGEIVRALIARGDERAGALKVGTEERRERRPIVVSVGEDGELVIEAEHDDDALPLAGLEAAPPGPAAGPVAPQSTDVVDEPWDGPGEVAKLASPVTKGRGTGMFAWYDEDGDDPDGDGYPDAKDDWKFPHHRVNGDGDPGPANVNGVRNALSRVTDADIPEGDKDGVRTHLQRHLDDFNKSKGAAAGGKPSANAGTEAAGVETTTKEDGAMRTIEELAARQDEIRARQEAIDAEHSGQMLPEGAKAEFDQLQAEWEELDATIADIRERKATLADKATKPGSTLKPDRAFRTNADSKIPDNIWDLQAYRGLAGSIEELSSLYGDGAKRAVEIAVFPDERVNRETAQAHLRRLLVRDTPDGRVARHILATGSEAYRRAWVKAATGKQLTAADTRALEMFALVESVPAEGGYAIPYTLDPTVILATNGAINPIRSLARQAQITGHQWLGVTASPGVVASYGAELTPATDDSPTLAQPVLEVEKAQAFVPLSIEVSQDWVGVEAELAKLFADAKDVLEANKFLFGAGHGSHEPEGLITALTAAGGSVIVDTGAINTFARDDLYELEDALAPRFEPGSSWLANRAFYNAVRSVTDDTFNIFVPIREGTGRDMGGNTGFQLLGYPSWRASEMSKAISTGGEKIAVLGDFEQFLVVDRIGMSVEFVPHLFDTGTGYPIGSRGLYAYWRNSSQVLVANAFRMLRVKHS